VHGAYYYLVDVDPDAPAANVGRAVERAFDAYAAAYHDDNNWTDLDEIDLAGGRPLALGPWECVVVPAGTVHRTRAVGRTANLTVEALGAETVFLGEAPTPPA
jgi:hypothetical protein